VQIADTGMRRSGSASSFGGRPLQIIDVGNSVEEVYDGES